MISFCPLHSPNLHHQTQNCTVYSRIFHFLKNSHRDSLRVLTYFVLIVGLCVCQLPLYLEVQ